MCLLETTKSECKYWLVGVGCSWSDGTLHVIMMNQRKKLACVDWRPVYGSNRYHFYIRQQSQNNW